MAWRKSPPLLIELFDSVVPRDPRVERRKMFGYPAAFAGGKLFAGLHQDSFILKLAEKDREQLQSTHGALPFEPMPGRRMKEYVVLPPAVLADRARLEEWLARSLAYVSATPILKAGRTAARPATAKRGGGRAREFRHRQP
jgi:TfoX/Sxy family transcriptional regulator of competence genes